jgi:hypothetical protein
MIETGLFQVEIRWNPKRIEKIPFSPCSAPRKTMAMIQEAKFFSGSVLCTFRRKLSKYAPNSESARKVTEKRSTRLF